MWSKFGHVTLQCLRQRIPRTPPCGLTGRAILEQISQSRPDSGLGLSHFQYESLQNRFKSFPQPLNRGYFFDFHIDAKPNDNLQRSVNVNVMLSPREDYEGGGLQVNSGAGCMVYGAGCGV